MDARSHYARLLGRVYSWMTGDFAHACRRNVELFERLGLAQGKGALALDLGSGHGTAALPLADHGYDVVAIDGCRELLDELEAARGSRPITTIDDDLLAFRSHVRGPAAVIVCLGDTLTHLPSRAAVEQLIGDVANALSEDGTFVATFRDYVSLELTGTQRFICVRSDESRILTCMLEYFPHTVTVHDLLHERDGNRWTLQASCYSKLRLAPQHVADMARGAGLEIVECTPTSGVVTLVAKRA